MILPHFDHLPRINQLSEEFNSFCKSTDVNRKPNDEEIRELLDSLTRESSEDLLKGIAETPIPKARKTRAKRTPESPEVSFY